MAAPTCAASHCLRLIDPMAAASRARKNVQARDKPVLGVISYGAQRLARRSRRLACRMPLAAAADRARRMRGVRDRPPANAGSVTSFPRLLATEGMRSGACCEPTRVSAGFHWFRRGRREGRVPQPLAAPFQDACNWMVLTTTPPGCTCLHGLLRDESPEGYAARETVHCDHAHSHPWRDTTSHAQAVGRANVGLRRGGVLAQAPRACG